MRPIRRFGNSSVLTDRFSSNKHHSIGLSRSSSYASQIEDDRRKLHRLFGASTYHADTEKENRRLNDAVKTAEKPEVILSTPNFQLILDRRRPTQARHSSADDAITPASPIPLLGPPAKSALKNGHRSRWSSFGRRTVSFADDKGLKLAEIRMIDGITDEYSTYSSLNNTNNRQASGFIADFILPPSYRRLRAIQQSDLTSPPLACSQIALESYTCSRWSATGVIAVRSTPSTMAEKRVFVRYTNDQWSTSTDIDATLMTPDDIRSMSNQSIDRYSFTLPFPLRAHTGLKLEFKFGLRMPSGIGGVLSSATYWDDNNGSNYSFTFV